MAIAATTRPALALAAGLGRGCVLVGLALVRRISVGAVARRLVRRARAGTAQARPQDRLRRVRVDRILLGLRVRIGVLLRLADLDDVLLLAVAATTRPARAVAGDLRRRSALIGVALVGRVGICLIAGVLLRRARTTARISTDYEQRSVRVQRVLLGACVRVGVLLCLADLDDVLLLAVAATTRPALALAGRLGRVGTLIGRAPVRSISVGAVVRLLIGRARTAVHVASGKADGNVGVDGVLLSQGIRVRGLLRLRVLDHVLLLAVATTAGRAPAGAAGLSRVRRLVGVALVRSIRIGLVRSRLVCGADTTVHVASGDADGNVCVHYVLLGHGIRVRGLLRLRVLDHVLLLAVATATGRAARAAARLLGSCVLIGAALVVCGGVGGVAGRLIGRTRTAGHVPARDADRNVGVDRILLGLRFGVGVLLRERGLVDGLRLACTATPGRAARAASGLRRGGGLIGRALVRRISVGLVRGRLIRRARAA